MPVFPAGAVEKNRRKLDASGSGACQASSGPLSVMRKDTVSQVGVSIIQDQLKVPAFNALSAGAALGDSIINSVGLTQARALDRAANE